MCVCVPSPHKCPQKGIDLTGVRENSVLRNTCSQPLPHWKVLPTYLTVMRARLRVTTIVDFPNTSI